MLRSHLTTVLPEGATLANPVQTQIQSELESAETTLSGVLVRGTLIVMVLYVMLNFTFLYVAPAAEMTGQLEIGYIAARHAFGETGAMLMGVVLAALLISTVSKTQQQATTVLDDAGYKVGDVTYQPATSASQAPGTVVNVTIARRPSE